MKNKFLQLFSVLSICTLCFIGSVSSVYAEEVDLGVDLSAAQDDSITATYDADTKTLRIKGTGRMKDDNLRLVDIKTAETLIFDDGITYIGKSNFNAYNGYSASVLNSIQLPSSLEEIGEYAFQQIGDYKNPFAITIPTSVKTIGKGTFKNSYVQTLTFEEGSKLTTIGEDAFYGSSLIGSITLPEGLESIGNNAFNMQSKLESVSLPSTLKSLGASTFSNCSKIKSFTCLSPNVDVGEGALGGVNSPIGKDQTAKTATILGEHTYLIQAMRAIGFNVTVIGEEKEDNFESYPSCEKAEMGAETPNNITLYTNAYSKKGYVKGSGSTKDYTPTTRPHTTGGDYIESLVFDDGIIYIGNRAFYGDYVYKKLSSIKLPSALEEIGEYAFRFVGDSKNPIALTIPASVQDIKNYAFDDSNIKTLTFEENSALKNIGEYAFSASSLIGDVILPEGLESIGTYAFQSQSKIETLSLPSSLKTIDYAAFSGCTKIKNFTCLSPNVDVGRISLGTISVPIGKDQATKTATVLGEHTYLIKSLRAIGFDVTVIGEEKENNWNSYPSHLVLEMGAETPSDIKAYKSYYTGELFVKGSGRMKDYSSSPIYAEDSSDPVYTLEIDDGITYIGNYAFKDRLTYVSEIKLPSTLEGIGKNAFYGAGSKLKSGTQFDLVVPQSVKAIESYAFSGAKVTSVSFEENSSMEELASNAFGSCSSMTTLSLPDSSPTIESSAFSGSNIKLILNPSKENQIVDYINGSYSNTQAYCYKANSNFASAISSKSGVTLHYIDDSVVEGTLETGVNWVFDPSTSTITFSGVGAIPNYTEGTQPWAGAFVEYGAAEKWIFNNTITSVGNNVICGIGGGSYGLGIVGGGSGGGIGGGSGGGSGSPSGSPSGGGPDIYAPNDLLDDLRADGYENVNDVEDLNKPEETGIWNYVDGEEVQFPDVQPRIIDGEIVSPIRFIFNDLGAEVYWNQEEQKATIRKEENGKKVEIVMKPGATSMWVNGAEYTNTEIGLDATVLVENGRCLLPGRAIIKAWETVQFKAVHKAPTSYKDYYYKTSEAVEGGDSKLENIPTIDDWQETNPGTKVTEDNETEVFKPSDPSSSDETQIIVDAEITSFKVTVPIKVNASMRKNGDVVIEGDYKVENQCALGPVLISAIKVNTATDWKVADFNADFANMKVNSKIIGISINGANVGADGQLELNEDLAAVIRHQESKDLSFEMKLPAQRRALQEVAAAVVFTVAFDTV